MYTVFFFLVYGTLKLEYCGLFCTLRNPHSAKSHDYFDAIVFENLCFQSLSKSVEKPAFSNPSSLMSVKFEERSVFVMD